MASFFETLYSRGIYPVLGPLVGYPFTLLPISFTDLSIFLALVSPFIILIRKWKRGRQKATREALLSAAAIYILFLVLWGFNYHRQTLAEILALAEVTETAREQVLKNAALMTNQFRTPLQNIWSRELDLKIHDLESQYLKSLGLPALPYTPAKRPLLGNFRLRLGNSGIFGPFTGEVNITWPLPPGTLPFVLAHERAHRNGFASETDASAVALFSLWSSSDPELHYSAWLSFWNHFSKRSRDKYPLSSEVVKDLDSIADFWKEHAGFGEGASHFIYDLFLKSQGQKRGNLTYTDSVDTVVRKFAKDLR